MEGGGRVGVMEEGWRGDDRGGVVEGTVVRVTFLVCVPLGVASAH